MNKKQNQALLFTFSYRYICPIGHIHITVLQSYVEASVSAVATSNCVLFIRCLTCFDAYNKKKKDCFSAFFTDHDKKN